jgi:hypothetical protein
MATVKESIKESLIGTTEEPQLSQEVKADFVRHAKKDEDGELYLGEEEFIDAIAPAENDVSLPSIFTHPISPSGTKSCAFTDFGVSHSTK